MEVVGLTFDRYIWPLTIGDEARLQTVSVRPIVAKRGGE